MLLLSERRVYSPGKHPVMKKEGGGETSLRWCVMNLLILYTLTGPGVNSDDRRSNRSALHHWARWVLANLRWWLLTFLPHNFLFSPSSHARDGSCSLLLVIGTGQAIRTCRLNSFVFLSKRRFYLSQFRKPVDGICCSGFSFIHLQEQQTREDEIISLLAAWEKWIFVKETYQKCSL